MSIASRTIAAVKTPLRVLRHLPDRARHGARRRAVLERLVHLDVRSATFICHGNINRSAYAAAAFMRSVPPDRRKDVEVRSSGFIGPGRSASEPAQSVARRRGLDLSAHRSRLVDARELRGTDLVVVMNTQQRSDVCRLTRRLPRDVIILGDLDPAPIDSRTIPDPYGHPIEVFEHVFDRIDRCLEQLSRVVWKT